MDGDNNLVGNSGATNLHINDVSKQIVPFKMKKKSYNMNSFLQMSLSGLPPLDFQSNGMLNQPLNLVRPNIYFAIFVPSCFDLSQTTPET